MNEVRYVENGINFSKVKSPNILLKDVIGRLGRININGENSVSIDNENKPFINAVDIDWNGAELGGTTINTTADLLAYILDHGGNSSSDPDPGSEITIDYTISCYRWYKAGITPGAPTGMVLEPNPNSLDPTGESNVYPTDGWKKFAPNRPTTPAGVEWVLWLSCALFSVGATTGMTYPFTWLTPFQISGINGTPGEDLSDREFIYKRFTTRLDWNEIRADNPANWNSVLTSDYTGPSNCGWSDNPLGIDSTLKYEYETSRKKVNGEWQTFGTPYIRSQWGLNGMDGDGVEYVFVRTKRNNFAPIVAPHSYNINLNSDDFLPIVEIPNAQSGDGIYGKDTEGRIVLSDYLAWCTDDPIGVNSTYKYEWVLKRKKTAPKGDGSRDWTNYEGEMSLWATYSETPEVRVEIINGEIYINGVNTKIKIEGNNGRGVIVHEIISIEPELNPPASELSPGDFGVYNNSVYFWTGTAWISLGQTNILPGSGPYYFHVAYADNIITTNGVITGYEGFNVDSQASNKKWVGYCLDNSKIDPGYGTSEINHTSGTISNDHFIKKYKWQYNSEGKDGNGVEYIYCLGKSESIAPQINLSDGTGNPPNDEFYPKITNYKNSSNLNLFKGNDETQCWTDDPSENPSKTWPILWWALRKKVNGEWEKFKPAHIKDRYTESAQIYELVGSTGTIKKSGNTYTPNEVIFILTKRVGSGNPVNSDDYYIKYSVDGRTLQGPNTKQLSLSLTLSNINPNNNLTVGLYDDNGNLIGLSISLSIITDGVSLYTDSYYKWSSTGTPASPTNGCDALTMFNNGWSNNFHIPNNTGSSSAKFYVVSRTITNGTVLGDWGPVTEINLSGSDGTNYEFIYKHFIEVPNFTNNDLNPHNWNASQNNNYLGPSGFEWNDNPLGVGTIGGIFYKYEFAALRTKSNGTWGTFGNPFPWSTYGDRGTDGDGVEYIFKAFSQKKDWSLSANDSTNPNKWKTTNSGFDQNEYYGPDLDNGLRTLGYNNNWYDNPQLINSTTNKYLYVSKRKQVDGHWLQFSVPALWSLWTESSYDLKCSPSALQFRANSAGDILLNNLYDIKCSIVVNNLVLSSIPNGYHLYARKIWNISQTALLYDNNWTGLSSYSSGTTFTSYRIYKSEIEGITENLTTKYLSGVEFCLSTADGTNTSVSDNNIICSKSVPITCDGKKGAGGGSSAYSTRIIELYRKYVPTQANPVPPKPAFSNNLYYEFSTGKLRTSNSNSNDNNVFTVGGGWYVNRDACANDNGDVFVSAVTVTTTTPELLIQILDRLWSDPTLYSDSLHIFTVFLYKRYLANNSLPTGWFKFNFNSGLLTAAGDNPLGENISSLQFNGWSQTIPVGTEPLYVIQATACNASPIDYIYGTEFSSPALFVQNGQKGDTGAAGKMFFSMGVWNSNIDYKNFADNLRIPMVYYDNGEWNSALELYGSYYYLNPLFTASTTLNRTNPEDDTFTIDSNNVKVWIKADNFGLIMTQGIFADFAKFGSGVISGDFMFSTNGILDGTQVTASTDKAPYLGHPTYMFFNEGKELTSILSADSSNCNTNDISIYTLTSHNKPVKVVFSIVLNGREGVKLTLKNGANAIKDIDFVNNNNDTTTFLIKSETIYLPKNISSNNITLYTSRIDAKNFPTSKNFHITRNECFFHPNWMVNLKTGEMIAAGGNFLLDSAGNVKIKGNIEAESGSIIKSTAINESTDRVAIASGDYKSVIFHMVENLDKYSECYWCVENTEGHNVNYPEITKTFYKNNYYYREEIIDFDFPQYTILYLNEYNNPSNEDLRDTAKFIGCSGNSNIILVNAYNLGSNINIVLPRAEDFKGKTIKVVVYGLSSGRNIVISQVNNGEVGNVASGMTPYYNPNNGLLNLTGTLSTYNVAITTSGVYYFLSLRGNSSSSSLHIGDSSNWAWEMF